MSESTIITGQFVRIDQTPASVGERMAAFLIDVILLSLYGLSLTVITDALPPLYHVRLFTAFALFMLIPLYPLLCEVFNHGKSIGKTALGIRVVKKDGSTPGLGAYLLRWLLYPVDFIFAGGMGVISMLVTQNNQRIGDLAAGTLVIKEKSYKSIQVSLDEFDYLSKDYRPTYPQAADLSLEQIDVICRTLNTFNQERASRIQALAIKVKEVLSLPPHSIANDEQMLTTLVRDYQYYALEEI